MFPHHCRPNLSLAVLLALSTLAKLWRVLSWGSATPLPVVIETRARSKTSLYPASFKMKGQGSTMLSEEPTEPCEPEVGWSSRRENRRTDVEQIVKETMQVYCKERRAGVLDSCIPPHRTPSVQVPVEDELGKRGTGAELWPRATERETSGPEAGPSEG